MATVKSDYLERLIQQLAELVRALLGLRQRPPEEAQQTLADAARSLLGMEYAVLLGVDATSAAQLLGDALRIEVLARLVEEDALLLESRGDLALALQRRTFALALLDAAAPLAGPHHPEAAARRLRLEKVLSGA